MNPLLSEEWHPAKNNTLLPSQIAANSGRKVWWRGACGHEWQATVASRNSGCGCPICRGLTVLRGFNDLETCCPEIAIEWNYEKNDGLLPSEVTSKNGKKVWWRCKAGHEYQATINARVSKHNGCPYCSHHRLLKGFNDLQTTHSTLAEDWNEERNSELHPDQVMAGSSKKVWWKCKKCGYEWLAIISNRSRGAGCPRCSNRKR